jgi:Invasion associated locus B (IalB) protein
MTGFGPRFSNHENCGLGKRAATIWTDACAQLFACSNWIKVERFAINTVWHDFGALPREVRMQRRRMRRLGIRRWRVLLLLGAAAWVAAWLAPARAQQSAPAASPPAATPAKPKPKPANPETKPEAAKPAAPAAKPASPAAAGGVQPKLLGQYGMWGAYTASPGGKKVCFALAKPSASETNPPNRPRNPVYMFISTRPADKVANEISLVVGYPFKTGTEATAQVGGSSFALYTQQDGAWIKNATDEAKMVDAMRGGDNAVIKGVSAKGTQSTDTFSLKGVAQALDRTAQECK